MKIKDKDINNLEVFLDKFNEENEEAFWGEAIPDHKLDLEFGNKIGNDPLKLERVVKQIWGFSSPNAWNNATCVSLSLWNTDETLHASVVKHINELLLGFKVAYNKTAAPEPSITKEKSLDELENNVDSSPYTVFWEIKKILPKNNDKKRCLEVILNALSNIQDDVEEHETSNYNSYFEPVDEDEPCYDELWSYQNHYVQLLEKVKANEAIAQNDFEYTCETEVHKPVGIVSIDYMSSDYNRHAHLSFLSEVYWNTPVKYQSQISVSFHKSLEQFDGLTEITFAIEHSKARNNTYDTPDIVQLLMDYGTPLWENSADIYKFNFILSTIEDMPKNGNKVKQWIATELSKKAKVSEVKTYLEFFLDRGFHFTLHHEKARKATIKAVMQTNSGAISACKRLAYFDGEDVHQAFVNCLNHSNPSVIHFAITGLSKQADLTSSIHHLKAFFLNNEQDESLLKETIIVFSPIDDPEVVKFLKPLKETYIEQQIREDLIGYYGHNMNADVDFNTYPEVDFDEFYSDMLWSFNLLPEDVHNIESYPNTIQGMNQLVLDHWKCKRTY